MWLTTKVRRQAQLQDEVEKRRLGDKLSCELWEKGDEEGWEGGESIESKW